MLERCTNTPIHKYAHEVIETDKSKHVEILFTQTDSFLVMPKSTKVKKTSWNFSKQRKQKVMKTQRQKCFKYATQNEKKTTPPNEIRRRNVCKRFFYGWSCVFGFPIALCLMKLNGRIIMNVTVQTPIFCKP